MDGWTEKISPFHDGEKSIHARLGIEERQEKLGRMVMRRFMPDQHREFFAQLPFIILGTVDEAGAPWASLIAGTPGFISTPTDKSMRINSLPLEGDPSKLALKSEMPVSLLGIEPDTRRRNRANLRVTSSDSTGFDLRLTMSFGNCPQYIQARESEWSNEKPEPVKEVIENLTAEAVDLIRQADTFFVASHNDQDDPDDVGGVDVNHRGGKPGFVKVEDQTLTVPDFKGNNAFNTLGNFVINPRAGLLFMNFDTGDLLQLTGRVEILYDADETTTGFEGAQRAWQFTFEAGHFLRGAIAAKWRFGDYARQLDKTGEWK